MTIVLLVAPALLAAAIAYGLTPVTRAVAFRIGAIDQPGARKLHEVPTPRLGGLAVIVATASTLGIVAILGPRGVRVLPLEVVMAIGIGVVPVIVASLIDDIRGMAAMPRLLIHFAGATTTVLLGVRLGDAIHLFGHQIHIGWLAIPISILWLAGTTNAFNIIDGLDGLSAGLALISCISLAAVSVIMRRYEMTGASLVLAGALVGFLPYNIFPAKVYLGDTGATALGFFLGALTLGGGSTTSAGLAVLLPILVLGVPVADTLLSMLRRFVRRIQGAPSGILDADRDHIHHRLLALGLNHKRAVIVLYGVGVLGATCALLSLFLNDQNAGLLLLTLVLGVILGIAKLGYDEFSLIRNGAVLRFYERPVLRSGLFVVFVDLALIAASIYIAVGLKYDDWSVRGHRQLALDLIALAPAVTVAVFGLMGIYRQSWSNANIDDLIKSTAAAAIASIATLLISRFVILQGASLTFFAMYAIVFVGLINGSRASYRILLHWNRRSNQHGEPVVIYGAGKGGALALREMLTNSDVAMRPVGFIDDDPTKHGRIVNGYPVFGGLGALEWAVTDGKATGVVVASEKIPIAKIQHARRACERNGAWLTYFQVSFRKRVVNSP